MALRLRRLDRASDVAGQIPQFPLMMLEVGPRDQPLEASDTAVTVGRSSICSSASPNSVLSAGSSVGAGIAAMTRQLYAGLSGCFAWQLKGRNRALATGAPSSTLASPQKTQQ